jgi:hypothetical protein
MPQILVLVFGVPLSAMRAMRRMKTIKSKAPIMMWSRNLITGLLSFDRFIVVICSFPAAFCLIQWTPMASI